MPREWKQRPRPRKTLLPPDATAEMIAARDLAYEHALDTWLEEENTILAEAIGEVSKIALSFSGGGRTELAAILAILAEADEADDEKPDPWLEALQTAKQIATAYVVSVAERQKEGCPDCAKPRDGRVVRRPANVVVELTEEELQHLAKKFGVDYVQAAIEEVNALRKKAAAPAPATESDEGDEDDDASPKKPPPS